MSLSVNELKPKVFFIFEGQPYIVLESHHLKMQQRRPVVQTRIKNLINGKIIERNFQQSDSFEEADIRKENLKFLYNHRDEYWFCEEENPSKRSSIKTDILGENRLLLKQNMIVEALYFKEDIIGVQLPIKVDYKVTEAPPSIRGDTATGGTKQIKIESGATLNVPLFIESGDIIRINTETGEYVERVSKF